jgi:cytochrome c oxidase subunit 1
MSDTKTHDGAVAGASAPGTDYLSCARGPLSWLFTLDHKRIGVMYLICTMASFFAAGVLALVIRTEHLTGDPTIGIDEDTYNIFMTLHGAIMVFLFIIPSIPGALGNFVLPIMLGAKDVAFPRLNLFSWWLWVIGAICALAAILMGSFDTGWTFYTPYSVDTPAGGVIAVVAGVFILGFSSIFTGLNFIVTVHKLRAPGQGWFQLPLFVWGIYATAVIQILATPVLGITLLLLIAERALGIGIFDPALGGDPVLFQHFFWFYSHPAVYIMILPAMAIISELIAVFSRQHIFGYSFIAFSSLAIALFGFLVWGHHMFVSTQSQLASMIFSAITFSIAIPSAVKVFNWMATMFRGSISLKTPMTWALSFLFIFVIGGLTGLHLGTMQTDVHLHDTYFVVAHFHYVMVGSAIAFFGGIHYWWPKMFGRTYSELWGQIGALAVFVGFNVTFLAQFVMGSHGMPRRYFNYVEDFQTLHQVSTWGAYVMGFGFAVAALNLIGSLFGGKRSGSNPWGGVTLEWQATSPPHAHNFEGAVPTAGDPYDFERLEYDAATGDYRVRPIVTRP